MFDNLQFETFHLRGSRFTKMFDPVARAKRNPGHTAHKLNTAHVFVSFQISKMLVGTYKGFCSGNAHYAILYLVNKLYIENRRIGRYLACVADHLPLDGSRPPPTPLSSSANAYTAPWWSETWWTHPGPGKWDAQRSRDRPAGFCRGRQDD